MGCTMMRKCHLNTCPVGIATQDPILRKKFEGKPEDVVYYFFMLAEEVRKHMASLGIRKFQELVGRTDLLKVRQSSIKKVNTLNFSKILTNALTLRPGTNIVGGSVPQNFELEKRLDVQLIEKSQPVIDGTAKSVDIDLTIHNERRTVGATLSYYIALKYGDAGLPEGSNINITFKGSAGQSFCAFLARGVSVTLEGDANDYVGKGLSGGEVTIFPEKDLPSDYQTDQNVIVGNVCLYGATSGKAFFRGIAAERFGVRNSGAIAVVEGVGDHGCEYMTGGVVVILGITGRNFAAGMSGGIAYVYDKNLERKCNTAMVELLPLEKEDDLKFVESLLKEFVVKTGSVVAQDILSDWPAKAENFVKVFPYEYQRALRQIAEPQAQKEVAPEPIKEEKEPAVQDIEDTIADSQQMDKSKAERILDKTRGFMKYKRQIGVYRPAEQRQNDWDEIYNHKGVRKSLRTQAARCMECGVPFCQSSHGCPLGNIIPKWNDLIFNNDWKEALNQLLQTNNFPEFTGRVCPAPCEGACVLGINELPVTIKNIEVSIIDHAFEQGWIIPQIPPVRTGKNVAVVGGGPAGLAAAHQLNKSGHTVTVLERNDRIGGLLQYGIPTMKLSKEVVQRRVQLLEKEGIEFKTNVNVGVDISPKELRDNHDAVVLCMGATWPRDLPIPGRALKGIEFAMTFLETWQKKQMGNTLDTERVTARDKNVIVIGGGDTGCDCIATSLRQGAKSITTFEILPQPPPTRGGDNPWPTFPRVFKVDYGHEEVQLKFGKDPRRYSTLTKEFLDDGAGNVKGVKTVEVDWTKDAAGRWQMKELEGTEKVYESELILLAMGFLGPEKQVIEELELDQDPRSNIKTPGGAYSTSVDKVFAAGDCRRGQSLVVWAISEGRQAAREVDAYLMGGRSTLTTVGGLVSVSVQEQQG